MIHTKQLFLWALLSSLMAIVGGADAPLAFQATMTESEGSSNLTAISSVPESNNNTFSPKETALLRPTRSLGASNYNSNPTAGSGDDDMPWCYWQSQFWDEMSTETQANLMALNETSDTWNNCMIVETWNLEWLELNTIQRQAALDLGFNPTRWYNAGFFSCDWECLDGSDEDDLYGSLTPGNGGANCLSEFTLVQVLDKGDIFLKDVELGDKILVSSSSISQEYQEVYSFGHKDVYAIGDFIQITTTGNQVMPLEITGEHLIMKQVSSDGSDVPVRADSIQVGDFLIGAKGVSELVTAISSVKRAGVYSPVTTGGTLVANGIVVSSYTALQDKDPENFVLGEDLVSLSHHLLSHCAIAPFRTMMYVLNGFSSFFELRNDQGQLLFAMEGKTIVDWIMSQAAELQIVLLTILLGKIFLFYLTEQIFCGLIVIVISALFTWVYSRRLSIKKSS